MTGITVCEHCHQTYFSHDYHDCPAIRKDITVIQDTCQHCGHLWKDHNYTGCLRFTATDDLCKCKLTPDDQIKDHELFVDTVVNDQGGKQSRLDMAFNEIEPMMLQRVARVLDQGKVKYGSKNWRQIPYEDHINHMQYHAIMANTDDTSEDHLANVICRAMFAMYMKDYGEYPDLATVLDGSKITWNYSLDLYNDMYYVLRQLEGKHLVPQTTAELTTLYKQVDDVLTKVDEGKRND